MKFEIVTTNQPIEVVDHRATGEAAARAREAQQLSMRAVAASLGCTPSYICDLEAGHRNWTSPVGQKYAEYLKKLEA
jgi:transcriptional regulator with XRE-family HTH domain